MKVVVINVLHLRFAVYMLQMDVICKDEQTFVRKRHVLILRPWAASPAPNARDPDVNGSRARRIPSNAVTLPSCKTNSKL